MASKLLDFQEASAFTRLPVNTLRYMRAQGTGPRSARIGRRVFYREEDLQAWLDAAFANDGAGAA